MLVSDVPFEICPSSGNKVTIRVWAVVPNRRFQVNKFSGSCVRMTHLRRNRVSSIISCVSKEIESLLSVNGVDSLVYAS